MLKLEARNVEFEILKMATGHLGNRASSPARCVVAQRQGGAAVGAKEKVE